MSDAPLSPRPIITRTPFGDLVTLAPMSQQGWCGLVIWIVTERLRFPSGTDGKAPRG